MQAADALVPFFVLVLASHAALQRTNVDGQGLLFASRHTNGSSDMEWASRRQEKAGRPLYSAPDGSVSCPCRKDANTLNINFRT